MKLSKENIRDIIVNARGILSDPSHWTKGKMAKDIHGKPTESAKSDAVCWCTTGALKKATLEYLNMKDTAQYFWVYDAFAENSGVLKYPEHRNISWNYDINTKHEDVLKAFDKAIAAMS